MKIPNLKRGAKKLALNLEGNDVYLENEILFANDKYKWAKDLLQVSEDVNNAYLVEFNNINQQRQEEGLELITVSDFKKLIINEYELRNNLLLSFNVYIKTANDKLTNLIEEKDIIKATQVVKLMEDVDENITIDEAENVLLQILSI